ncbi:virion core protein, T7 gp14 family [Eleftheria terrae]|uniref:virion core protein, T7 gp14 family n=1 Tax=Eleftheria terrae TaxID=1597781 RepID=UPI00263A5822|nr:hypothetical protein [Eleftheria terrae]WKB53022.1 hypothetical protein N7L95_01045 [Eleftheria terrae]
MCTGLELAFVMAAGASTAVSVYGQQQAGKAQEAAAEAQGRAINQQAGAEQDAAEAQADRIRRAARAQVGEANAALSASGVSVGEGTALKITEQIIKDAESDALNAIISGNRGGRQLSSQARSIVKQGQDARRAANISSIGTVLSGASQAFGASGWRSRGPGWSGTQAPAPVYDRSIRVGP